MANTISASSPCLRGAVDPSLTSRAPPAVGSTPTNLKVPFLNYMANIRTRAGQGAIVRVGGNSQEGSTLFLDGLKGNIMDKIKVGSTVVSPA